MLQIDEDPKKSTVVEDSWYLDPRLIEPEMLLSEGPVEDISQEALVKMTKKYNVTSSGSKKQLAERLWYISGSTMSTKDLHKIVHLLSKDSQKKVMNEIKKQIEQPITNYMGMWYPQPKPLDDMSRSELLKAGSGHWLFQRD